MREVLGYIKTHEDRAEHDYYATPPQEINNILQYEKLSEYILDPCCGEGHMAEPLKKYYHAIKTTDLIDRGYGEPGLDFLSREYPYTTPSTIIMNPPFKLITEFTIKAIRLAPKVVLFARLQFLETIKRYKEIFSKTPPQRIYIYADRVNCAKNGDFSAVGHSSMAFAWFVWDEKNPREEIKWIRKWGGGES